MDKNKLTKDNHYNPKMYLKNFAIDSMIYRYDKQTHQIKRLNYEKVGFVKKLYTQITENLLSQIENQTAKTIKNLRDGYKSQSLKKLQLSPQEISYLIMFMAIQLPRLPSTRSAIEGIIKKRNKVNTIYTIKPFGNILEPQNQFERAIDYSGRKLFEEIKLRRWKLQFSSGIYHFITSDKVISTAQTDITRDSSNIEKDIIDPNRIIIFPISKELCFVLSNRKKGYSVNDGILAESMEEKEKIRHLNGLIWGNSERFIYASEERLLVDAENEFRKIRKSSKIKLANRKNNRLNKIFL